VTLTTFPCKSHIFRKGVRKVIVRRCEGLLKRGDETSKSAGKWKMWRAVQWSETTATGWKSSCSEWTHHITYLTAISRKLTYNATFHCQKFHALPTHFVSCVSQNKQRLFPYAALTIGFCNWDRVCSWRGTTWVFIYNSVKLRLWRVKYSACSILQRTEHTGPSAGAPAVVLKVTGSVLDIHRDSPQPLPINSARSAHATATSKYLRRHRSPNRHIIRRYVFCGIPH